MGFVALCIFLVLSYWRPGELYPALAPLRLLLVFGAVGLLLSALTIPFSQRVFSMPPFLLMIGFLGAIAMSRLAQGWIGGAVYALQDFAPVAAGFFMVAINVNTMTKLRVIGILLIACTLMILVQVTMALYFGYRYETFILEQRVYENVVKEADLIRGHRILPRVRHLGTLNDPNDLAQTFVMMIPFVFLAWRKQNPLRNVAFVLAPSSLLIFGIYLTRSRGGIMGLLVVVLFALKDRLGRVAAGVMTATAGIALIGLNFAGGRSVSMDEGSASERLTAWSDGIQMLRSSPLFGVGYRQFVDNSVITAHNSFVLCFAELGLLGYLIWVALLITVVFYIQSLIKLPPGDPESEQLRRWANVVRLGLYGFLASAIFLSRTYVLALYILLGLAVALRHIAVCSGKQLPPLPMGRWVPATLGFMAVSIIGTYLMVRLHWMG